MKYTLLTLGIAASLTCSAQNSTTIESLGGDVLYRGYTNQVTVQADKEEDRIVQLNGRNVVIKVGAEPNSYVVKPANGKTATLYAVAVEGENVDTLYTQVYEVRNLPVPDVYWGEVKEGGTADRDATKLSIRYHEGVKLPNNFRITAWEISTEDGIITGLGDDLSSAKTFLENIESGSMLTFVVKVLSADGIMRMMQAQWKV